MDALDTLEANTDSDVGSILITGGLGFIGSHVAAALAEKGYPSILLVDNLSNCTKEPLYTLQTLYPNTTFTFYEADVRHSFVLDAIFDVHHVEAVIHMAALKAVGESVARPWDYYDVNVAGTLALLQVMEAHGCYKFVFSSSSVVYGSAPPPLTEDTPTGHGIASPYGKTKWMVEEVLKDMAKAHPNRWRIQILRYFNPIGAHPSGLLGEDPKVANNLFPIVLRCVAGESVEPVTVFGTDYPTADGTCVRDYLDVWDLAKAHVGTFRRFSARDCEPVEIYNVGTGRGTSVFELLTTFEESTGVYVPVLLGDRRAGDLVSVVSEVRPETRERLGWTPTVALADSCRRGLAFMNRHVRMDPID